MSIAGKSLISCDHLTDNEITQLFSLASLLKGEFVKRKRLNHLLAKNEGLQERVLALVFSEPSTRTRLSFQMAASRLGMRAVVLDNPQVASLSKGETLEDTIRNVAAMWPDLMVVRYNVNPETDEAIKSLPCPVINGGIGAAEHPTQALLDAFTIQEFRGKVSGERVLIVGDVLHSRVANSNLLLLKRMGAEIAYCAPSELTPRDDAWKTVKSFSSLDEGVNWATVVMGLRVQKERHGSDSTIGVSVAEYREKFRIGGEQLKRLVSDGILLHPGPVIPGVEFSPFVLNDPRCKVRDQVTNGVFVRAALMAMILGLEVQKP